jgi:hypothetical protein
MVQAKDRVNAILNSIWIVNVYAAIWLQRDDTKEQSRAIWTFVHTRNKQFPSLFYLGRKYQEFHMVRIFPAICLMALASPAIAQDGAAAPQADLSAPPPMTDPAPAAPAPEPTKAVQVKQVVEANFPTYDTDQSGDLNDTEFAEWLTVMRQKSAEAKGVSDTMPESKKKEWMQAAFTKADADQSKVISKSELETFLLG